MTDNNALAQDEYFILGTPCPLAACPIGLFFCVGELCLKTEYGSAEGRIDAFIVETGEFFWGEHPQTIPSQREQTVTPVLGLRTQRLPLWVGVWWAC